MGFLHWVSLSTYISVWSQSVTSSAVSYSGYNCSGTQVSQNVSLIIISWKSILTYNMQLLLLDSDNDPVHIEACSFYVGTKNINWGFKSPGMCHYGAVKEPTAFQKNCVMYIVRSSRSMKLEATESFQTSGCAYPAMQCHIPKDQTRITQSFIKTYCIWPFSPKNCNIIHFKIFYEITNSCSYMQSILFHC